MSDGSQIKPTVLNPGVSQPDVVPVRRWGRRWFVATRYRDRGPSYGCSVDRWFYTRRGAENERRLRVIRLTETTGALTHWLGRCP